MRNPDRTGRLALIRYKGGIKGEDVIDDHSTGDPFPVRIGSRQIPKGIEDVLYEMAPGEQRVVEIPCELGFGTYNEDMVNWYPRPMLERGYELKRGSTLTWTDPQSAFTLPARVIAETQDAVRIDINHPFAGKILEYWVEFVEIE